MRVVTTCHEEGFRLYGHRWLEGRKNWPKGTEFWFYTEGYKLPSESGLVVHDFEELREFSEWKATDVAPTGGDRIASKPGEGAKFGPYGLAGLSAL